MNSKKDKKPIDFLKPIFAVTVVILIGLIAIYVSKSLGSDKFGDGNSSIETTIPSGEHLPVITQEIDDALTAEQESGQYTMESPLVVVNPYNNSPLTALVIFNTEESYGVKFTVKGDKEEDDIEGILDGTKSHRVPIVGLYGGRENTVTIELLDKDGHTVNENVLSITTDPLPDNMIDIVKPVTNTVKSAYDLIQVSGQTTPHPMAFDSSGVIRWYLDMDSDGYGIFPLSNNNFIFLVNKVFARTVTKPHAAMMYEMDYLGRAYSTYFLENGAHHEVIEKTEGGNLLVLSNSNDEHVEDYVQELDRETGEVVKSLIMTDIFGDTYVDMVDWIHLNTVSYDEATDTILVCARNVHSGVRINWTTDELVWILGHPEFWEGTGFEDKVLKPVGDIIWHFQPHTIYEEKTDFDNDPNTIHIMMYDNHWDKTRKVDFYDNSPSSFVSLYTIDEKKMEVSQERVYEGVKSKITSNYTFEPDFDGGRVFSMGGYLDPEIDGFKAMIGEYDFETEELLNQYGLKYRFYRSYEFKADYTAMGQPLDIGKNYVRGELKQIKVAEKKSKVPSEKIDSEDVSFRMIEDILFMESGDHKIKDVEFIGKKRTFTVKLSNKKIGKGHKKYKEVAYEIPISVSNLKPDTYKIVVNYEGTRYNTDLKIKINK